MKYDEMQFFEKLNGICPLCQRDITVATSDYWGCPESHFFVELDGSGYVNRVTMYADRPQGSQSSIKDFNITIYPQKHLAYVKPRDMQKIIMPLVNEQIMFSFITTKVFKKCETMMLLK
jgi:hypothetical protein